MANKDDYLTYYREFFENFAQTVNPNDQLPVKLGSYKLVNVEVVGGIIDWTAQYLTQKKCPTNLIAPLIKIVIEEIRKACKKQPMHCGFNPADNAYEPLKLMQTVMAKTNEVCLRYLDNSMLCSLPVPGTPFNVTSSHAVRNSRKRMEDRHVVIDDLNTMFNIQEASPSSYYAVFDGHAGQDAASYSAAHLHQYLAENKYFVSDPKQALMDAFCKTDALFIEKCKVENLSSGTTAVVALLRPKEKTLFVAWAGDSQALLVNQGRVLQVVNPHKPCREDEKERIEKDGGCVMLWGTWRVNGQLAVSRAIGDAEYKPYVTAIPEIQEISLDGGEDFLIIACDGLWDFLSEDSAAAAVYKLIAENPDDTDRISQHLVHLSKKQGSNDNISVIVVFLREPSKIAAEACWSRGADSDMEASLENANNPFGIQNGAGNDNDILAQKADGLLLNLTDNFKRNGSEPQPPTGDFFDKPNGNKRSAPGEFDYDDDLGPETDVDALDDPSSPAVAAAIGLFDDVLDEGVCNPFVEHQEKAAMEMGRHLKQRGGEQEEGEEERVAREEAPTPPADAVHDVSGLVENAAESDSEDEWNYIKGDEANKENEQLQPETKVAEIPEEDDTMSQLNPNAAEFVPVSPTRSIPSPSVCAMLMNDPVIAQSPKRPVKFDIKLPKPSEFEREVKSRPSDVDSYSNGHNENEDRTTPTELMETILNGKNIDDIPEFQPGSTPKKGGAPSEEFHFGPNAAPFTPIKPLDQSETALSTRALFGDESVATLGTSYNESTAQDLVTPDLDKEADPMSMSFYAEQGDANPFDPNKVHVLPDDLDAYLQQPDDQPLLDDTISDLPENDPLAGIPSLDNDDAIQTTDLDKRSYDDEKELASPLEPENEFASPLEQENELASPLKQENELVSPLEPENELATPLEPENELASPLEPEKESVDSERDPLESDAEDVGDNQMESLVQVHREPCELDNEEDLGIGVEEPDFAGTPEPTHENLLGGDFGRVEEKADFAMPEHLPPDVELITPENTHGNVDTDFCHVGDKSQVSEPENIPADVELISPESTQENLLETDFCRVGEKSDVIVTENLPADVELIAPEILQPEIAKEPEDVKPEVEETNVELETPELKQESDAPAAEVELKPETAKTPEPKPEIATTPEPTPELDGSKDDSEACESDEVSSTDVQPTSPAPKATEVEDLLGAPEVSSSRRDAELSPDSTSADLVEDAQRHFDELCAAPPEGATEVEDVFAADQSTLVCSSARGSPKDGESVATTDVNSFLDRSLPPEVESPMSPGDAEATRYPTNEEPREMSQQELDDYLSHPLSKCVFPLPPQFTNQQVHVETDVVAREFAEPTVVVATPSEEGKQELGTGVEEVAPGAGEAAAALGVASAVAAVAVAATAVEEKKKTGVATKKPVGVKNGAAAAAVGSKRSPAVSKVGAARTAASPRAAPAKIGLTKPATTAAAPKTAAPKPISKPKTTTASKVTEKKPLANGDVKPAVRSTLTSRKAPSDTTSAPKTTTSARLATSTSKPSPTKPMAPKPTAAPRPTAAPKPTAAPRPAAAARHAAAARPATATGTSSAKPTARPTTLTARPQSASTLNKGAATTTRTAASKSMSAASKSMSAAPKSRAAGVAAPASRAAPKAADAEKQSKESANKITAARTAGVARVGAAAATRRVESKTSATRTIISKTSTTTTKSTTAKKPLEIIKTKTTRIVEKQQPPPHQNGTAVIEEFAAVVDVEQGSPLKDASPVADNKMAEAAAAEA